MKLPMLVTDRLVLLIHPDSLRSAKNREPPRHIGEAPHARVRWLRVRVYMRELAKDRQVPDVQTMQTSPPRALSEEEVKKAVDSRNQFGEPKIRPPYDQLPADIQRLRLWASSRPPRVAQSEDYLAEELQQMYRQTQAVVHPFGDTPLITIVAMRADAPPRDLTKERWEELVKEKVEQKRGHADLSTNSKVIDDPKAGYHVHLDDPDTVVAAVRDVIIAVLHHTPLAK